MFTWAAEYTHRSSGMFTFSVAVRNGLRLCCAARDKFIAPFWRPPNFRPISWNKFAGGPNIRIMYAYIHLHTFGYLTYIWMRQFEVTEKNSLHGGPKKRNPGFNFGITSVNVHWFWPSFYCYNRKCMTQKSKITPATSPLFCNPLPSKTHTTANIDATFSNV